MGKVRKMGKKILPYLPYLPYLSIQPISIFECNSVLDPT
jgi:hypothetical protein